MLNLMLGGSCFLTDKMGVSRILAGLAHKGITLYVGPQAKRIRAGDEGLGSDGKSPPAAQDGRR